MNRCSDKFISSEAEDITPQKAGPHVEGAELCDTQQKRDFDSGSRSIAKQQNEIPDSPRCVELRYCWFHTNCSISTCCSRSATTSVNELIGSGEQNQALESGRQALSDANGNVEATSKIQPARTVKAPDVDQCVHDKSGGRYENILYAKQTGRVML